mgnify:FL=1
MFLKFNQYITESIKEAASEFLFEGGSFGHMAHPYDDVNLTFGEIKDMISDALQGGLNKEAISTEKLDGQAIAVSWKDGELIASRNQGDRKNAGANSLSVQGVIDKFAGRGDISDAFAFAIQDLSGAISKINPKKRDEIFKNGQAFMHLELIYPPTTNVINYDSYKLIFHNTSTYDMDGVEIDQSKTAAGELTKAIKDVNADIQKTFQVDPPKAIEFAKNVNFEADRGEFFNELAKIQKKAKMNDNQSVRDYIRKEYSDLLYAKAGEYGFDLTDNMLDGLIQRFAYKDMAFSVRQMKREITNKDFFNWLRDFEKKDAPNFYKKVIGPIETLFLKLGVRVIKLMTGLLALDPEGQIEAIKVELDKAIKGVRAKGSEKEKSRLEAQLKKLEAIGGMDAVLPTEGIVFQYKGKTYKLTGGFAPINQILGIFKYVK